MNDKKGDSGRARFTRRSEIRFRNANRHTDDVTSALMRINGKYTSGLRTLHQLCLDFLLDRKKLIILCCESAGLGRRCGFFSGTCLGRAKALRRSFFVSAFLDRRPHGFGWWGIEVSIRLF